MWPHLQPTPSLSLFLTRFVSGPLARRSVLHLPPTPPTVNVFFCFFVLLCPLLPFFIYLKKYIYFLFFFLSPFCGQLRSVYNLYPYNMLYYVFLHELLSYVSCPYPLCGKTVSYLVSPFLYINKNIVLEKKASDTPSLVLSHSYALMVWNASVAFVPAPLLSYMELIIFLQ